MTDRDCDTPHIGALVGLNEPLFIHPTALLYGKITIAPDVSIFPYVVMRAEAHEIRIGARTNIQDFVMVHVGDFGPTIIGEDCSLTHRATLHGCTIGDRCLIGIGATVMDGATIGDNSIVAGHAIVESGKSFGPNAIIAGVPARQVGERDNSGRTLFNADVYRTIAGNYAQGRDRFTDEQLAALLSTAKPS